MLRYIIGSFSFSLFTPRALLMFITADFRSGFRYCHPAIRDLDIPKAILSRRCPSGLNRRRHRDRDRSQRMIKRPRPHLQRPELRNRYEIGVQRLLGGTIDGEAKGALTGDQSPTDAALDVHDDVSPMYQWYRWPRGSQPPPPLLSPLPPDIPAKSPYQPSKPAYAPARDEAGAYGISAFVRFQNIKFDTLGKTLFDTSGQPLNHTRVPPSPPPLRSRGFVPLFTLKTLGEKQCWENIYFSFFQSDCLIN